MLEKGGGPCQEVLEKSEWGLDTWAGNPVPVLHVPILSPPPTPILVYVCKE